MTTHESQVRSETAAAESMIRDGSTEADRALDVAADRLLADAGRAHPPNGVKDDEDPTSDPDPSMTEDQRTENLFQILLDMKVGETRRFVFSRSLLVALAFSDPERDGYTVNFLSTGLVPKVEVRRWQRPTLSKSDGETHHEYVATYLCHVSIDATSPSDAAFDGQKKLRNNVNRDIVEVGDLVHVERQ